MWLRNLAPAPTTALCRKKPKYATGLQQIMLTVLVAIFLATLAVLLCRKVAHTTGPTLLPGTLQTEYVGTSDHQHTEKSSDQQVLAAGQPTEQQQASKADMRLLKILPARRVLVTGAAGFIGFHTAKALAQLPDTFVLGLDNFNSYYNATLKKKRQAVLSSCCNVDIVQGDIRNSSLLRHLFDRYQFTQVVHLAAQAGVRLSVKQPLTYVSNNIEGTVAVLQAIVQQQQPFASLVYASSSSVYGVIKQGSGDAASTHCCAEPQNQLNAVDNSSTGSTIYANSTAGADGTAGQASDAGSNAGAPGMPLRGSRECSVACGEPVSAYAVSKLAAEKMVAVYQHQYGITATGLRFFTVYGPYGRPDMAVMSFSNMLLKGAPITIPCFPAATSSSHKQLISTISSEQMPSQPPGQQLPQIPMPPKNCVPPIRDFTYISDVVSGILAACNTTAAAAAAGSSWHKVYNLGRGWPASILQLLQLLQLQLQRPANVTYNLMTAGSADVQATWADTTAARQDLAFNPSIDLQQGLQGFVDWYLKQRQLQQ